MCFKRGCHTAVIDWGRCQKICISQQDPVKSGGGGEKWGNPLEPNKAHREFFSVSWKWASQWRRNEWHPELCLMSEAWVCTELLYNSTPIGSERKRQLNPLLEEGGGRGLPRGGRRGEIQERKRAWEGKRKKRRKKKEGAPQSMWREEMRWNTEPEQMW